jgi:ABC-type transport system involved in multi-copper enzyme maturation permease subunit
MAVATAGRASAGAAPARGSRGSRAGLAGTLRSELTKIRSVRSTYWSLLVLVLASVGFCVAFCAGEASRWPRLSAADRASFDPAQASVVGLVLLGQLVIVVLGALAITSEYSTGMMRTSLTVMPRRGVLYGAKVAVLAAVSLVIATVTSFGAFFLGQALLTSTHAGATLSQPNVLRAVIASALFVTVCGLCAFGLGAIVRHTAGAITAAFGIFFLLPQLAKALPSTWYADVVRWLPGGEVTNVITVTRGQLQQPHLFGAWGELAVLGGYAAVLLVAGALLFGRRDA